MHASYFRVTNIATSAMPSITLTGLATAILHQGKYCFEEEILSNAELICIGTATVVKV
jgi:hypothetical protein